MKIRVVYLHLYLKWHSCSGVLHKFCKWKSITSFLHKRNISRKWVTSAPGARMVLKYFNVHIYIIVHFIIFIYWKLSLLFSESLLCGNPGLRKPPACCDTNKLFCGSLVGLKGCGDVMIGCDCTNLFIWYLNTNWSISCFTIQRSGGLSSRRIAARLWQYRSKHLVVWNPLLFS